MSDSNLSNSHFEKKQNLSTFAQNQTPLSLIRKAYKSLFADENELSKYVRSISGVAPSKIKLYQKVFRHRSAYPNAKENNERLEFLGDSVLDMLVAEFLLKKYPYREEGFLTEMRSKIVNRASLNAVGKKLGLSDRLEYAKRNLDEAPKDLDGNTLEALLGAIYIDAGLDAVRRFVHKRLLQNMIDVEMLEATHIDFKSRIFHYIQRHSLKVDFVISSEQSKNRRAYFVVDLMIDGKLVAQGEGLSNKGAEQAASMKALTILTKHGIDATSVFSEE